MERKRGPQKEWVMNWIKKRRYALLGIAMGMIMGWMYWHQWGCTEHCPIRSNPLYSTLYGGAIGFLLADWFQNVFQKSNQN